MTDQIDNVFIHGRVVLRRGEIPWRPDNTYDPTDILVINEVSRAVVELHKEPCDGTNDLHQDGFHLHREEKFVRIVDIVHRPFRAGQQMPQTAIVTDKDKVLLISRCKGRFLLPVLTCSSEEVIPKRHEQTVIRLKVSMVTQMKLRRVKQVLQRRILACKQRVANAHVGMTPRINGIEQNQIGTDNHPMLTATEQPRRKKGWTEGSNVDEMLLEILYIGCGGQRIDR
mmetsp:Transcript_9139/g.13537  ORF Transcript_9139/g.13537 Transcript_9139/m.13537 type:complete len:227 (+) Transcript_9139:1209-1889(+)